MVSTQTVLNSKIFFFKGKVQEAPYTTTKVLQKIIFLPQNFLTQI